MPDSVLRLADSGPWIPSQLGMRFHADMLNRLFFTIITITIVITFFCTFVQSWARYSTIPIPELLGEK